MSNTKSIFLHALTPIHSGTGQAAAVIDLPIAREKSTGYPVIPASSLKGVLRDGEGIDLKDESEVALAARRRYGSEDAAGELIFSDQKILCFPARSLYGTLAYVTCPLVLGRLKRESETLRINDPLPYASGPDAPLNVHLAINSALKRTDRVIFDDLDFKGIASEETQKLAETLATKLFDTDTERQSFISRFALVHDDIFAYLVETATEVSARIALSETKTVDNLWYEEAVPAEAIFSGVVIQERGDTWPTFGSCVQIGGKASVGRGLCRMVVR